MKPILFNTEMVQAILDGKKTVTRRCIKGLDRNALCIGWRTSSGNEKSYGTATFELDGNHIDCKSKYLIGDILYVRETFMEHRTYVIKNDLPNPHILFRADYSENDTDLMSCGMDKWKPSIHMPKEYARLFLRVTNVRIERLQEIRYYEVFKEGIKSADVCNSKCPNALPCAIKQAGGECSVIDAFKTLWNSTVKESELEKYGWNANPWVWVYEFEIISKEEAMKVMV